MDPYATEIGAIVPTVTKRMPWAAFWRYSASRPPILYSGDHLVIEDALITSVSTNPGGENPFRCTKRTLSGSVPENKVPNPTRGFSVNGPSSFADLVPPTAPGPSWSSANIWARTNPTRPSLLLPVFWLELRDIPDMIRQAGRFLLAGRNWRDYVRSNTQTRDLATANLAFQFGWAPLIGDLYKLATFQDSVDKRRKEIRRATRSGGYRRRVSLGSNTIGISGSTYANFGSFTNFRTSYTGSSTAKSWAVAKWRPTSPNGGLPSKDGDLRPYLLGLHPSQIGINLWEALPWSWLVDYFTNIGELMNAGNHHLMTPNGGSVMTMITTTVSHPMVDQGAQFYLTGGSLRIVTKSRSPASSSISDIARSPSLGAGQLSILGSLAVLKGRRTLGS